MKKNIAPLLFGVFFLAVGILYFGSTALNWNINVFFDGWWTLFIIVPTFISILSSGPHIASILGMSIGVLLLLNAQGILRGSLLGYAIVAAAILAVGVGLITSYFRGSKNCVYSTSDNYPNNNAPNQNSYPNGGSPNQNGYPNGGSSDNQNGYPNGGNPNQNGYPNGGNPDNQNSYPNGGNPDNQSGGSQNGCDADGAYRYESIDNNPNANYNAIFSSVRIKNVSDNFISLRTSSVFGASFVDLSEVKIKNNANVYLTSVFGSTKVAAPKNVKIIVQPTNIFGGTNCRAQTMPPEANVPTCTFITSAFMGGIEIY